MKRSTYISLIFVFISLSLSAQNNERIRVEGIARMTEVPKEIILSIDLTIKDSLYQTCFNRSMAALEALKENFTQNGIDAKLIKSKHIAVNEAFEYRHSKRVKTGYVSSIALEVKGNFTQKFSESLLNSLNMNNLDINYRLAFGFSDEQKTKLRQKAIELAVADAKQKAETLAGAAGLKLGKIASIQYGNTAGYEQKMSIMAVSDTEASSQLQRGARFSGIELNPKEQLIQKSVQIEWYFE